MISKDALLQPSAGAISENVAAHLGTGVRATANSVIKMGFAAGDTPRISDNGSTNGRGGGVFLQFGGTRPILTMSGNASLVMGANAADTPSVMGNSAVSFCGGMFIDERTIGAKLLEAFDTEYF